MSPKVAMARLRLQVRTVQTECCIHKYLCHPFVVCETSFVVSDVQRRQNTAFYHSILPQFPMISLKVPSLKWLSCIVLPSRVLFTFVSLNVLYCIAPYCKINTLYGN